MQDVLILSRSQSYLIISTKESLEKMGYKVYLEKPDINKISQVKEKIALIIVYCDENLLTDTQTLFYIKDIAVESDIPIYTIGDVSELEKIAEIIPKHVMKSYVRPFNVKELVEAVDEYIKTSANDNKKKILVVDDSGAMLRSIKNWLSDKYHVILANSGTMAIKYLVQNNPDLILLDYEMPIVDGKQVLQMIRSETEFDDIPVIFLTSKGDKESVMNVMSLKPEGYLLKTMNPVQIVNTIDEFFEKRKAIE